MESEIYLCRCNVYFLLIWPPQTWFKKDILFLFLQMSKEIILFLYQNLYEKLEVTPSVIIKQNEVFEEKMQFQICC